MKGEKFSGMSCLLKGGLGKALFGQLRMSERQLLEKVAEACGD